MSPLVSILIPCHNAKPWLAKTIESALGQTWPECEVIVVDDGSTDDSLRVAREFDPRGVRVYSQPNRGAGAARNAALNKARGEYIQFLDADDLISPDKIERQLQVLRDAPPNSVASCAWGRFESDPDDARFVDEAVFRDLEPVEFLLSTGNHGYMMHPAAWLCPTELLHRAGPWDESLSLNDDGEYFCRVLLCSPKIVFTSDVRSYYRSRIPGSLSRRSDRQARHSYFVSIKLIEKHLRSHEDSERVRESVANLYQRFIYAAYPETPKLVKAAKERVKALGGSTVFPPMGRRTAIAARLIGWRLTWRIKSLFRK